MTTFCVPLCVLFGVPFGVPFCVPFCVPDSPGCGGGGMFVCLNSQTPVDGTERPQYGTAYGTERSSVVLHSS